jgi:pimeloyl-ACP methyl ester carboxylesterase
MFSAMIQKLNRSSCERFRVEAFGSSRFGFDRHDFFDFLAVIIFVIMEKPLAKINIFLPVRVARFLNSSGRLLVMEKILQSQYKNENSRKWLETWLGDVLRSNALEYQRFDVETYLGNTSVLAKNHTREDLEPVIFLPGGRTCGIFWDINNNLAPLYDNFRIYLIDVNGQPGLSAPNSPPIDSDGYGRWLKDLVEGLGLRQANFVGASFGGSLIMKLGEVDSALIKRGVMCNPAGFVNISFSPRNLYYLLMPMIFPSKKSALNFLDKIAFHKDFAFDAQKREQLAEFILYTNMYFQMAAENPRPFPDETLKKLDAPSYLILDRDDIFIPQQKTLSRAEKLLPNLKETVWLEKHGHGIEPAPKIGFELKRIFEMER